jgi:predicted PurR-regulated permease PerM
MKASASILNPILLAPILVITVAPFLGWLQRKGLPGGLALLIVVLLLIGVIVALVLFLGGSINQLVQTIPTYRANAVEQKEALQVWLADKGIDTSQVLSLDVFDPEKLFGVVGAVLADVIGGLSNAVFMLMVAVFMLAEATGFSAKLHPRLKTDHPVLVRAGELNQQLRDYMRITTVAGVLVGAINAVFLLILGVDFPILWGVLSWLLSYIQGIGFWLAMIPPLLLAWLEFGWARPLIVFVGYVLINSAVQNILKPKLMKQGLNLAPVVTVLSLFFWGWVLGVVGALLAVPLTLAVNKLLLEGSDETGWLVDLMQGEGTASGEGGSSTSQDGSPED